LYPGKNGLKNGNSLVKSLREGLKRKAHSELASEDL